MPVRGEGADWSPVFNIIRAKHPDVPIFIFGQLSLPEGYYGIQAE